MSGPFFLTWHQSRGCGALDNPLWVHLASLHCQFPYGWSSCPLHSWMPPQSWASWHPSLSRRGFCNVMPQHGHTVKTLGTIGSNYQNTYPLNTIVIGCKWALFYISGQYNKHTHPGDPGQWLEGAPPPQPAVWSSWCHPTWPPLSDPNCFPPSKCFLLSSPLPSPRG